MKNRILIEDESILLEKRGETFLLLRYGFHPIIRYKMEKRIFCSNRRIAFIKTIFSEKFFSQIFFQFQKSLNFKWKKYIKSFCDLLIFYCFRHWGGGWCSKRIINRREEKRNFKKNSTKVTNSTIQRKMLKVRSLNMREFLSNNNFLKYYEFSFDGKLPYGDCLCDSRFQYFYSFAWPLAQLNFQPCKISMR